MARRPARARLAPASARTVVSDDWADLTDGSLQAGIDLTEKGERATGGVWTATNPKGDGMSQDCDEWDTTGGVGGAYGTIGAKDEAWTVAGGVYGCATELALYCFEH